MSKREKDKTLTAIQQELMADAALTTDAVFALLDILETAYNQLTTLMKGNEL